VAAKVLHEIWVRGKIGPLLDYSPTRFKLAFVVVCALYLAQGLYYARVLVPVADGVQYLLVGSMAVRGEISVYDDRLPGNRVPLPFWVLGLTQVAGPSLLAARWSNVGFGLLTILVTGLLAHRLAGRTAALLAALFLATQGVIVAYYSYESYPAFAALSFAIVLFVVFGGEAPIRRVLGAGLAGGLFLVRSNLWPAIPLLLGWALWRSRSGRERLLILLAAALPPALLFVLDPKALKLLAYVPVARRLVAPLGYVSAFVLDDRKTLPLSEQLWEIARITRRYEFWALAVAVLVAAAIWQRARGRAIPPLSAKVRFLAGMLAVCVVALFAMYSWNFRWVGLYVLPYAPLLAVLLGVGYAAFLSATRPASWPRAALLAVLAICMAGPLWFVRNPLLPTGEMRAKDPFRAAHVAAARLRAAVPPDAKVFFYGLNTIYYLAGLQITYLQQVYQADQFVSVPADERVQQRSGFVTPREMREWLTRDADYAVFDLTFVEFMRPEFGETEREMERLLRAHFDRVATIDDFPYDTYAVYRRKAS
jgi:4-amino-4-deoxy-L-arabinose transferase-like glycosyltransferase